MSAKSRISIDHSLNFSTTHMHTYKFTAALMLLFVTVQVSAQPAMDDARASAAFEQYIKATMPVWKTPGLSAVVIRNGNVVFRKGFGVIDAGGKEPFTTATLSACASTTKAMTAVCMGILVDEGKIKWSDKVSDVLPSFKLSDPYSTAEITVLDLFTHNTGLGNADFLWVMGYNREEIVQRMQWIPPAYSLRASYIYQNLMYMVAGEVIKAVSGKTWDVFITERIFNPLGMKHTYADHSAIPADETVAHPHYRHPETDSVMSIPYLYDDNIGAAGGVFSCADDMAKWLQCMSDSSKGNGIRLIKPATWEFLFAPKIVIQGEMYPTMSIIKPHWQTYGMGWFQHDYRGRMLNYHTGSLAGMTAIAGILQDQHTAVYIFGNLDHAELRHALLYKALDLFAFGDNTNDWSGKFYPMYKGREDTVKNREKATMAKRINGTTPSLAISAYAGTFTNKLLGQITVEEKNGKLRVVFPNKTDILLEHWHYDIFRGTFTNWWNDHAWVQFYLDKEGRISSISLDGDIFQK